MWGDEHWARLSGSGGVAEVVDGNVYLAMSVRNSGSGVAVIHGWHPTSIEAGLERNPGIVVTAAHCVNSIPYVVAAEPGIRTYLDLPLVAGRAHPDLARRPG